MKKIVLEIIEAMTRKKQKANKFPNHILDIEFTAEMRKRYNDALIELHREKKIKFKKSVNNNCIQLLSFSQHRENDKNK